MSLEIRRDAVFDARGRYRYSLTRRWEGGRGRVAMILLNPSTADARRDDPTLRRCIGFARGWGFQTLEVVNLFAFRTPHPARLRQARFPIGPENDAHLLRAVGEAERVVLAWGVHGNWRGRDAQVLALLGAVRNDWVCLGRTRDGLPRHVLFLPGETPLTPFGRVGGLELAVIRQGRLLHTPGGDPYQR